MDFDEEYSRPLDFGSILSKGLRFYGRLFGRLVLTYALFLVAWSVVRTFAFLWLDGFQLFTLVPQSDALLEEFNQVDPNDPNSLDPTLFSRMTSLLVLTQLVYFLNGFVAAIFENVAMVVGISIVLTAATRHPKETSPGDLLRGSWGTIIGLSVLLSFVIKLGLAFVLPGVLFVGFLLMAFPACAGERLGLMDSLRRGYQYSRGNFWKIVFTAVIAYLVKQGFVYVFDGWLAKSYLLPVQEFWYDPASPNYFMAFLSNLVTALITSVIHPVYAALYATLYLDVRARYAAYPGPMPAWRRPSTRAEPARPSTRRGGRPGPSRDDGQGRPGGEKKPLYCPYCGNPVAGDTCDNCGQSLPFKR